MVEIRHDSTVYGLFEQAFCGCGRLFFFKIAILLSTRRKEAITGPTIRRAQAADVDAIWEIFRRVVEKGDTYVYAPDTDRDRARQIWMADEVQTYVALRAGEEVVGTYILKENQPDLGSHICNAAFMVDPQSRGQGIGRAMGEHAIAEAKKAGFAGMQFNFVVATNKRAIALWEKLGFAIVGTVPATSAGTKTATIFSSSLLSSSLCAF